MVLLKLYLHVLCPLHCRYKIQLLIQLIDIDVFIDKLIANSISYLQIKYILAEPATASAFGSMLESFPAARLSAAVRTCGCAAVQQGDLTRYKTTVAISGARDAYKSRGGLSVMGVESGCMSNCSHLP